MHSLFWDVCCAGSGGSRLLSVILYYNKTTVHFNSGTGSAIKKRAGQSAKEPLAEDAPVLRVKNGPSIPYYIYTYAKINCRR